ncbi:hypothetical protein [Fluviicola sp.]|uniref:hypothetical protein n=1 Tax=Fluviicola sp. TaxID=1917219 RepID=UPI0031D2E484
MKKLLLIAFMSSCILGFAQKEKRSFKDYFNEFHISVNHGIPFGAYNRTFFGGGLGMSHVFRADRTVGARAGLDLDFFHFWNNGGFDHFLEQTIINQHLYLTSLSIPINLRINLGEKKNLHLELGGRLGFNLYSFYEADILHSDSTNQPYFVHERHPGGPVGFAFAGVNSGLGYLIQWNEKMDFLIRPTFQLNIYDLDRLHIYTQLNLGIHLK